MIGHGAKLPRKRQQAIAALIEAPTIREAAGIVGIGEATLFRWLQDSGFQEVYRETKQRIVSHAVTQLQRASGNAVKVLTDVMNDEDKPASSRVTAAKTVLDMAVKAVEIENLEARITDLERLIQKN